MKLIPSLPCAPKGIAQRKSRRILQGYTNAKETYAGILDKCPAVSPIDATVAESLGGMEIRRHERYFSLDAAIYREWSAQADVWLMADVQDGCDDDDRDGGEPGCGGGIDEGGYKGGDDTHKEGEKGKDVCTFAPRLQPKTGESANVKNEQITVCLCKGDISREICTKNSTRLHPNPLSFSHPISCANGDVMCVFYS